MGGLHLPIFMDFVDLIRGVLGLTVLLAIAFAFSSGRRQINWRIIGAGLGLQIVLALFILRGSEMGAFFAPLGWPKALFSWISRFFVLVLEFTEAGTQFVFARVLRAEGSANPAGSRRSSSSTPFGRPTRTCRSC